tara:strand:+ start:23 stop:487 length:465 start_codon:yes stop_codon:yes gene_type:complete
MKNYQSISTGEPCNAAQFVAEIVCVRKRERFNEGSLEYKFWSKSHQDEYQTQIKVAWKLIKKFSEQALVRYINSPKGKNVYSLGFLHKSKKYVLVTYFVRDGVSECYDTIQKESLREKPEVEFHDNKEFKPRKGSYKKNRLSKIREIDDNENKE